MHIGTVKGKSKQRKISQTTGKRRNDVTWTPLVLNNNFVPCHAKLYRVAFRLMGNVQDAEDMVQEAYLKLWKKRDELSEVASIEAYCVTLIKNLCYDSLRSCRPDEDSRLPEELKLPTDSNIAREIEQKDEARQVKRLIRQLPGHSNKSSCCVT